MWKVWAGPGEPIGDGHDPSRVVDQRETVDYTGA